MTPEQLQERKQRMKKLLSELKKLFPNPKIALNYKTNWELVVAVVLSAQCTDKRVNEVTKKLFKKYKKLDDYVQADLLEFEQNIKPTGYYRAKAKNILAAARVLQEKFKGTVPQTLAELMELPGVGRKTANVVLTNAFDKAVGIAVDTHVRRFVIRYDLSDYKDVARIEQDLMEIVPEKEWLLLTHYIIAYGRTYSPAMGWKTENDPILHIFPKAAKRARLHT